MAERVLVTGASGFIAQHLILRLLDKGYEVRGTVRSEAKGEALKAALAKHNPAAAQLELVLADLGSDDGWDAAVRECTFVQHVASPLPKVLPKDPNELIGPARDGALRVLRAARAEGVKRVVLTSSMAAIAYGRQPGEMDVVTEEHWSDPEVKADNTAYTMSKTIAEKAAWDYVKGEGAGLELATINPCSVLGPVLSDKLSASVEIVTQLLGGKLPALPDIGFQIVDVRDVADAHILAMEKTEAAGQRFAVTEEFMWYRDVAELLRGEFPQYTKKIPKRRMPSFLLRTFALFNPVVKAVIPELGKQRVLANDKAKSVLGWSPRSAHEAVLASARTVIEYDVV